MHRGPIPTLDPFADPSPRNRVLSTLNSPVEADLDARHAHPQHAQPILYTGDRCVDLDTRPIPAKAENDQYRYVFGPKAEVSGTPKDKVEFKAQKWSGSATSGKWIDKKGKIIKDGTKQGKCRCARLNPLPQTLNPNPKPQTSEVGKRRCAAEYCPCAVSVRMHACLSL
jgi:hypothetical protein